MGIKDALARLMARTQKVKTEVTKKTAKAKVAKQVAAWPVAPRILAGCSSFGMSGVNAHMVLSKPGSLSAIKPQVCAAANASSPLGRPT
jgi:acyl transferase domain-containing protein